MTTKTTKKLTKKTDTPIVNTEQIAQVFEHCESDDFELSVCHLVQGVDSGNFRDVPAGGWVESTSGSNISGREFLFVQSFKERIAWHVRDNATGQTGLHSRYAAGVTVPPEVVSDPDIEVIETLSVFVLLEDAKVPSVVRMKRTALRAGRSLNSAERGRMLDGKAPGIYSLGSATRTNGTYNWFIPAFETAGTATAEQAARIADARRFLATTRARVQEADGTSAMPHVGADTKGGDLEAALFRKPAEQVDDASIPF